MVETILNMYKSGEISLGVATGMLEAYFLEKKPYHGMWQSGKTVKTYRASTSQFDDPIVWVYGLGAVVATFIGGLILAAVID